MKVLHINSYYSGSHFYKNLYDKQKESGLDIDVYVPVSTSIDTSELQLGEYTTISANHSKYDRLFFHIKHNKICKDVQERYNIQDYSLIHAHSLFSNGYIAMRLKRDYGMPYVVAVRNTDVNVFFKYMIHLRRLGVKILRNAKKIIFISVPYKEYTIDNIVPEKYKEEIKNKSIVLPNGIDEFWFDNKINRKERLENNELKIIYVGVINSNKNIETTIKVCETLIEYGYSVNYIVVGQIKDNKYKDFMKKYSFIRYIPHCKKEELISHYRSADMFIMPSKHETFGLVYVEAMSQGLPVIYTKGQGFDGQFKEGEVGYSVQYDSAEEIAEKIELIIKDYETVSKTCIEKVDRFDWNKIADKYLKIYFGIAY